jgi:hypothetical protein
MSNDTSILSSGTPDGPRSEKEWMEREMRGFNPEDCPPSGWLRARGDDRISKEELVSLGQICSKELDIKLFREHKRRNQTMLKWFTDHWDTIHPFLDERLEIVEKKEELQSHQIASKKN